MKSATYVLLLRKVKLSATVLKHGYVVWAFAQCYLQRQDEYCERPGQESNSTGFLHVSLSHQATLKPTNNAVVRRMCAVFF